MTWHAGQAPVTPTSERVSSGGLLAARVHSDLARGAGASPEAGRVTELVRGRGSRGGMTLQEVHHEEERLHDDLDTRYEE